MKSIEEKVEEYYKKKLDELNIKHYGKTQANELNSGIAKALRDAPSKSGGNGTNYPDIMLMINDDASNRHIPVMIEAKGSKGKLEKIKDDEIEQTTQWKSDSKPGSKNIHKKGDPNYASIEKYAVNGAYHYSKVILNSDNCSYDEVIFIGINGTDLDSNNQATNTEQKAYYLSRENKMQPKHIIELDKSWDLLKDSNSDKLISILDQLVLSDEEIEDLTNKTEDELEKYVKKIHQEIYEDESLKNALSTNEKLYLFSGLIMAGLQTYGVSRLKPDELNGNDDSDDNDGQVILRKIKTFLKKRNATGQKISMIQELLSPIFTKKILWKPINGESLIRYVYNDVYKDIIPLLESDLQLDFTGKILNSLNDWVSIDNDRANDVVLTPRYVTRLMVDLTKTDMDSYVWDTAMGSGGFLVSAMDKMLKDAKNKIHDKDKLSKKVDSIKQNQLLGVELLGNIYILAVLNMILMGDGSSHMKNDDSHHIYKNINFPANVFLLNPPYSSPGKGFNFVEEAFSMMNKGYGAILIQENAGSGNGLPYTKRILENNSLLASIHMPIDLFNGKSSVQTSIYVFEVNVKHDPKRSVKFIDFSDDGYARQNRKKSSQAVNLRDVGNAKERYQEVVDIVLDNIPDTDYYTEKNGKLIKDRISLEGDDWTYNQHIKIDVNPTEDDFKKTVSDYLSFRISQLLEEGDE